MPLTASWDPGTHFNTSLVNMPGEGSYPIVAVVFGLASDRSGQRAQTARAFLKWSVTSGRATAEKLGYVALPLSVVQNVEAVCANVAAPFLIKSLLFLVGETEHGCKLLTGATSRHPIRCAQRECRVCRIGRSN
jgi:hypothetical protein